MTTKVKPAGANRRVITEKKASGVTAQANYTPPDFPLSTPKFETALSAAQALTDSDDAIFNLAFSLACETNPDEWPDVDALADLILAEVREAQAETPEDWIAARLAWYDAHYRYWFGGQRV
jgi:hypothetical protein